MFFNAIQMKLYDHQKKKKHVDLYKIPRDSRTNYSNFQVSDIQHKPVCPCDGGCPRCTGIIQPKLTVGQPNDIYEQEADRMADMVMRMPEPEMQRPIEPEEEKEEYLQAEPLANKITPLVQKQVEPNEEEEELLQTKISTGLATEITPELESHINVLKDGGQPLPESTRAYFEPRFGRDFSRVRVHSGTKAAETAQKLNAQAFTWGHNIVFSSGRYQPQTAVGQRLLAHELTHTLQQSRNRSGMHVINDYQSPILGLQQQTLETASEEKEVKTATSEEAVASKAKTREITFSEVQKWIKKMYDFPYGFSEFVDDVRIKSIGEVLASTKEWITELDKKLIELKESEEDFTLWSPNEEKEFETIANDLKMKLKNDVDNLKKVKKSIQLEPKNKEKYWNHTLEDLVSNKIGTQDDDILNAIKLEGIVCNTFIEIVMRMSGFIDFPLSHQSYTPQTKKYIDIEKAKKKKGKELHWAERIVDWALNFSDDEVIYDYTVDTKKTLPKECQAGDIVIFQRKLQEGEAELGYHVNFVIASKDKNEKYELVGARGSGKPSGHSAYIKEYSVGLAKSVQQAKLMWIIRPKYKAENKEPGKDSNGK